MRKVSLTIPVFESGIGNQIPQKTEKKKKARIDVLRVAGIKSYVIDEKGNEYLCNSKLLKDLKKGYFIKARVEDGKVRILTIFG